MKLSQQVQPFVEPVLYAITVYFGYPIKTIYPILITTVGRRTGMQVVRTSNAVFQTHLMTKYNY
jgi:hypothetical protein